jgi:hypothetical protein
MRPNCHISVRIKGCCDTCGNWPSQLHMPEELHGWYCGHCCPACKAQPAAPSAPEAPTRSEAADVTPPESNGQTVLAPQAA